MRARFYVEATFRLPGRELFVAHGRILDGAVRNGQRVVAPTGLDARVDAVEFALISAADRRENVALCFRYGSEQELARWQELALAGQILELVDEAADADRVAAV